MAERAEKHQAPRGTRDLYPVEAARRRWLMDRWREVSLRHGFEEVDGPTFETADLYAVKSGEGILGELFQAFSGKSPEEVEQVRDSGRAPYALRPEFTPTLARMYAARAAGLPKPCKWFMAGPFFRAERPQRGRLREFLQWNVDVLGLDIPPEKWNAENAESKAEVAVAKARMDAECIACCVALLAAFGLSPSDCKVVTSHRGILETQLREFGVPESQDSAWFAWFDAFDKRSATEREQAAKQFGASEEHIFLFTNICTGLAPDAHGRARDALLASRKADVVARAEEMAQRALSHPVASASKSEWDAFVRHTAELGLGPWMQFDPRIVRGLAYYTGTVFEVIADGERAVAGGGRYDNLVELFGGPKTPAVGFAMGDVVLSLLLQDKGLMPSDEELMGLVGQRPDVFVISNGTPEADAALRPLVATLRRGSPAPQDSGLKTQDSRPLHARHSYKATKNVGKLLKEASHQGSRFAVIIEDADSCTVKDLESGEQWAERIALDQLGARLAAALS
jgi:histidyl-tRNA synthetase